MKNLFLKDNYCKSDYNTCNAKFYQQLPLKEFYRYAQTAGLDNGCDIDLLDKYIEQANSILEVGAGYGRTIDRINQKKFQGVITAIERETRLYKHLQKKYQQKNINIIHGDIRNIKMDREFDLVLFMWAGIAEYEKKEQLQVLKKLTGYINKNKYLVLDLIPFNRKPVDIIEIGVQKYIFNTPYGMNYNYCPNKKELLLYAKEINASIVEIAPYKTSMNISRLLYILQIHSL